MLLRLLIRIACKTYLNKDDYVLITKLKLYNDNESLITDLILTPNGHFAIASQFSSAIITGKAMDMKWIARQCFKAKKINNPLRDNHHILRSLESDLLLCNGCFKSIAVFMGPCQFESELPLNVCKSFGFTKYIKSFNEKIYTRREVQILAQRIKDLKYKKIDSSDLSLNVEKV